MVPLILHVQALLCPYYFALLYTLFCAASMAIGHKESGFAPPDIWSHGGRGRGKVKRRRIKLAKNWKEETTMKQVAATGLVLLLLLFLLPLLLLAGRTAGDPRRRGRYKRAEGFPWTGRWSPPRRRAPTPPSP